MKYPVKPDERWGGEQVTNQVPMIAKRKRWPALLFLSQLGSGNRPSVSVCSVQCAVCTAYCVLCTVHCALHWTWYVVHLIEPCSEVEVNYLWRGEGEQCWQRVVICDCVDETYWWAVQISVDWRKSKRSSDLQSAKFVQWSLVVSRLHKNQVKLSPGWRLAMCTGDFLLERHSTCKSHFYLHLQPSKFFSIFKRAILQQKLTEN